jgi:hypothetical protein
MANKEILAACRFALLQAVDCQRGARNWRLGLLFGVLD